MDPSKRVCLKNLPENCTKREIAEMVRNRTGAQPHSIDLGLDSEGHTRRYAHFSCEGAKSVLEVLAGGAVLRGETVQALPARQHYSHFYAEARRKRERAEEEERTALAEFWEEKRRHFLERTDGGELPKKRTPKSFYASKQKYALVASDIARKLREEHAARRRGGGGASYQHPHKAEADWPPAAAAAEATHTEEAGASTPADDGDAARPRSAGPRTPHAAQSRPDAKGSRKPGRDAKKAKTKSNAAAVPAPPPPPPAPPQPSKEERKLSGLQAKLAALKEKMQRK